MIKNISIEKYCKLIQSCLTPDLRKRKYRWHGSDKLGGHCYVASEALYHLMGGRTSGYTPATLKVLGETHWYLQKFSKPSLFVIDVTMEQFSEMPRYWEGRGRGFLTRQPSKRAVELMSRVKNKINGRKGNI